MLVLALADGGLFCSGSAGLEVAAGKDGKAVDSKEGHYAVRCPS